MTYLTGPGRKMRSSTRVVSASALCETNAENYTINGVRYHHAIGNGLCLPRTAWSCAGDDYWMLTIFLSHHCNADDCFARRSSLFGNNNQGVCHSRLSLVWVSNQKMFDVSSHQHPHPHHYHHHKLPPSTIGVLGLLTRLVSVTFISASPFPSDIQ